MNDLANNYLDLLTRIKSTIAGSGLQLTTDVSFSYGDSMTTITRNGQSKTLIKWVLDIVDKVVIMNYRDNTVLPGPGDNMLDKPKEELAATVAANKKAVIAVETAPSLEAPKVTFAEEGTTVMEQQLALAYNSYKSNYGNAFAQLAIHDYEHYSTLAPSYTLSLSNPTGGRGIFVWGSGVTLTTSSRNQFFQFAQSHAINSVYLDSEATVSNTANQAALTTFLQQAASLGIKVEFLFGNHQWVFPGATGQDYAVGLAQKTVAFLKTIQTVSSPTSTSATAATSATSASTSTASTSTSSSTSSTITPTTIVTLGKCPTDPSTPIYTDFQAPSTIKQGTSSTFKLFIQPPNGEGMRKAYIEFLSSAGNYGSEMTRVSDNLYTYTTDFNTIPARTYTVRVSSYSASYAQSYCNIAQISVLTATGSTTASAAETVNFIPDTADFTYSSAFGLNNVECYSQRWDATLAGEIYAIMAKSTGGWYLAKIGAAPSGAVAIGTQAAPEIEASAKFVASTIDPINRRMYTIAKNSDGSEFFVAINISSGSVLQSTKMPYSIRSLSFNLNDGNVYGIYGQIMDSTNVIQQNIIRINPANPSPVTITISPILTGGCAAALSPAESAIAPPSTLDMVSSTYYFSAEMCDDNSTQTYLYGVSTVEGTIKSQISLGTDSEVIAHDFMNAQMYGMSQFSTSYVLAGVNPNTGVVSPRTGDNIAKFNIGSTAFVDAEYDYMNQKFIALHNNTISILDPVSGAQVEERTPVDTILTMSYMPYTSCCLQSPMSTVSQGNVPVIDLSHVADGCQIVLEQHGAASVLSPSFGALVAAFALLAARFF
jgi:hypothetical protein